MPALVGFKRMTINVLDGGANKKAFVVEGKQDEGAMQTAKISGLSADTVKTYGSNVAYHVSRKGVGDVSLDLEGVDIPEEAYNAVLGYVSDTDSIARIGTDTEPPYCSVLLESETIRGETALFGFYKGSFSTEDTELKTTGEKTEELTAEKLKFSAIASDSAETKGYYVAKYIGSDEAAIAKIKVELGLEAPTP